MEKPLPGRIAEMALEELGGKYERTDGLGNFVLKLPKLGQYRLLFISRNAQRPAAQPVSAAQLALSLIGEGTLRNGDDCGPADEMLRRAGLTPIVLEPKEGLTLINGTQAHTAVAALAPSVEHRTS